MTAQTTAQATAQATARRLATPREQLREARLRLVTPGPVHAPRLPFVVVVVAILTAGLLSLLMLNTLAAQDSFRLHDLQRRSAALADSEQQLKLDLDRQSSPSSLAGRARALGMLPAESPAFLRLRDGRIVGVATAAPLPPPPPPPAATQAKPTTKPGAKPARKPTAKPARSALPRSSGAGHSARTTPARPRPTPTSSPAR